MLSLSRRVLPVWLMGLSNTGFGLVGGFIAFTLPQALAAQRVPETTIAAITAVTFSPLFFMFLFSPMLDVWFSRRWYAAVLTILAAVLVGISVMNIHHLLLLEITVVAAVAAMSLAGAALCGWLSTVARKEDENQLSAWLTVANFSGFGIMSIIGAELIEHLPLPVAAFLLTSIILVPALIFLWIPAPGRDLVLAGESFRAFWVDVFALLRRRQVLVAIALFLSPCGTFSLTNILGGLGNDFHAAPRVVSVLGGSGAVIAGICGSLLLPILAKHMPLRPLYLTMGMVGGVFTLGLILLPRTPESFAAALIGENIFQSLTITCSIAIIFEITGRDNPLAATTFALISAAYAFAIVYMPIVDGWGYGLRGVAGAFAADAGVGIVACLLMGLLLFLLHRTDMERLSVQAQTVG
jgi:MFS transporter, PAT family, beta-lactamase induction signal transducer AmpG